MAMLKLQPIHMRNYLLILLLLLFNRTVTATTKTASTGTSKSIIFTTLGRPRYAFDLFFLPTRRHPPTQSTESRITDGNSVNFNGHFPSPSSALLSLLPHNQSIIQQPLPSQPNNSANYPINLIYVTERGGSSAIYYDVVFLNTTPTATSSTLSRVQIPLLKGETGISMKDRPCLSDDLLIYVSTHEDPGKPRTSWSAVYSTHLTTGSTRRLTPSGIADFSPSVSPSGFLTAVASYGETGWTGEVQELSTGIYVFLTRDPTHRVKVVQHGGWPTWVDDSTFYFHRRSSEDDWISVYRAILPSQGSISTESVVVERVTPPGLHAFTPAASPGNHKFIAVATRRPNSGYRHIELFDLVKNEFTELTRFVSPLAHHLNPFLSPDSERVGYHRCRGGSKDGESTFLFLENVKSPLPKMSLFRFDGSFPAFSPAGDRIVYVNLPGVYVVNRDGSNRRQVYPGMAFSTAWNPARDGIVYTSTGPTFASESAEVDIISIHVDADDDEEEMCNFKKLTTNGKNNAFPSVSPDGRWVVFRSSRSGNKNLYVMDGLEGEKGGLYRLTEGAWTDTMCNWSPDGEWIAFSSDRETPGLGSFELFVIHPNGTGLRKLVQSGLGGRVNHPSFSPDGDSLVFTTDYGAISAEPMSNPHHYQPYGEIYTIRLDGSGLKRLTHNSYEDGTPVWSPAYIDPVNVEAPNYAGQCSFEDCHWLHEMPKPKHCSNWTTRPRCGARAI